MTTDHISAAQVHAGDELLFTVRARCAGTTACSAHDEASGDRTNFIIFTLIPDDPDGAAVIVVERSESVVTRASANVAIGAAA